MRPDETMVPGPLERALEWSAVMIGLVWLFVYIWVRCFVWPRRAA